MAKVCCLAGIEEGKVAMLSGVLREAGITATTILARLHVTELGHLAPELIVCDVDHLDVDPLELLRQIRFVLPRCVIAVFTGITSHSWALSCHLAGVNCILSKGSTSAELSRGVREGLLSGCYTDPRVDAA